LVLTWTQRHNKSWNRIAWAGFGSSTHQLAPSYVSEILGLWNFHQCVCELTLASHVYLPHVVPSGDLRELPVLVMPTPPLRVFRVNTCAPVENRDPQEQATLCFAGCELPPGAVRGTATVPAPIILPTVVKTLPAGIHTLACVPQDRQNPPRLYRYWKTRYSDRSHLDPGSGNFVTYGELIPVMHC
jgi:hypothetical protein